MPFSSDSDSSDTTTPSSSQRVGADVSDAEHPRHMHLLCALPSRQAMPDEAWEEIKLKLDIKQILEMQRKLKMKQKLRAGEERSQGSSGASEPACGGPPTVHSKLINVAPEGMVPVMMREDGGCHFEWGDAGMAPAEMERECSFSLGRTVTTTTDPVVKLSWGPEIHIVASGEVMKSVKHFKEREKERTKEELKLNRAKAESFTAEEIKPAPIQKSPKDLLTDEIVDLMSPDKVLSLENIKMRINQPDSDILEILEEVAFLWEVGDLVGRWELKYGFRRPVVDHQDCLAPQAESVDASDQEHDTESDAQPIMSQLPMPPPSTPHAELDATSRHVDLDQLKHSLSMPTLPSFHSISDAALVATYTAERAKDPAAFDKKTASIRESLVTAKIRRGGSNFLAHGDYTVELASREDAAKAERWNHGDKNRENIDEREESSSEDLYGNADKVRKPRHIKRRLRGSRAKRGITSSYPTNFDLAENVSEYTTSGSLRQQSTRQIEEDESGTKTTHTTWIEIKQELYVPKDPDVELEEVFEAVETAMAREPGEAWKGLVEKGSGDTSNGRGYQRKKRCGKKVRMDFDAVTDSSDSTSEEHDGPFRKSCSQKVKNGKDQAVEATRKKDAEGGRNKKRNALDAARMVGELVAAIDNLRGGKAEPEADFLEAISKQMLEVARFVDQSVIEAGADGTAG